MDKPMLALLEGPTVQNVKAEGPTDLSWESAQRSRKFEKKHLKGRERVNKQAVTYWIYFWGICEEHEDIYTTGIYIPGIEGGHDNTDDWNSKELSDKTLTTTRLT